MRDPADRLLTIPNLLSVLRLAGVPLFLYLLLGPREDGWALLILVFAGFSDWLDGKLARWLNQMSNLGALLDPAADRLYVFCTLLAFVIRDIVPLWVALVLVGREVVVGICLLILRQRGWGTFEVTYLGKAATFNLLYAFPLLLLAQGDSGWAQVAQPVAYAFTVWGGALYLWSALLYVYQFFLALRVTPRTVA
ncbi:CDP-diacylglycerol--glycerol-3-phosphate 3-phosphatidyltransferase [Lentzea albidocapillata subsp. violacea]|uniref:CDP-diacylglycerol--glycerol-3-phosphate 3-phosphatidyltransferase n=1 Tax=Lentzea albidocapillata subsp. violacea TaxID=128104 RepID=A0A1G9EL28_9PSEU|nr:CDP-alcohol phosphatidyltransferase family protein [Lentzea albidocapillata]SDK76897.1 CDP-diacylglycerol--glycerol-3-phosphate 3-phosphatidyltransferase [Lentzea albidocapillata subsp. violacea]